ncbi:28633_t:CDS:2, partial [Gigaspora margarita]
MDLGNKESSKGCAAVTKYRSLSIDYAFCRVYNNNRVPANPNKIWTEITVSSFRTSVISDPKNIINVKKRLQEYVIHGRKNDRSMGDSGSLIFDKDNQVLESASKFYKMEFELMKVSLTISGQLGGFTKLDL